jgi:YbbR domain-containing protein
VAARAGRPRYFLVALVIAALLWLAAHGASPIERSFDLPLVFHAVPEDLVIVEQNTDVVNVRLLGSRGGLRTFESNRQEYAVDVGGARAGAAEFEVDVSRLTLPRGVEAVSRSPSQVEIKLERRGTKVMQVRADLSGEPAPGFRIAGVEVDPARVRVSGARREVLRLSEAVTEPVDVAGLDAPVEREARVSLGGEHVWVEDTPVVRVRIQVVPDDGGRRR